MKSLDFITYPAVGWVHHHHQDVEMHEECVYLLGERNVFVCVASLLVYIYGLVGLKPSHWLVMTSSVELRGRWPPTHRTVPLPLSLVTDLHPFFMSSNILIPNLTFNKRTSSFSYSLGHTWPDSE